MIESAGHRMLRDALKLTRILGYTQREHHANLAQLYYWGHQYDHLAPWTTEDLPLREKAPSVRIRLTKTIVDTLASHLFGSNHQPRFRVEGDTTADAALQELLKSSRLAAQLLSLARIGTLTGTAVIGFRALEGQIDWSVTLGAKCVPQFGRDNFTLARELGLALDDLLELDETWRTYEEDETGYVKEIWHRRVWSTSSTTEYIPIEGPIRDSAQLDWVIDPERSVEHNLGFVPAEWIRNLPVIDDIDGAPVVDAPEFEIEDEINYTLSQTGRGIRYNQEPTLALFNADIDKTVALKRGSHHTLDIKPARNLSDNVRADAELLEMEGEGGRLAIDYAQKLTDFVYQVTRVVVHDPDRSAGVLSGVALQRVKEPMLALVGEMQPQYEHGLTRVLAKAMAANGKGRYGRLAVTASWPASVEPTLEDNLILVEVLRGLRADGLITRDLILQKLAPFLGIDDVASFAEELDASAAQAGTVGENTSRENAAQAAADLDAL